MIPLPPIFWDGFPRVGNILGPSMTWGSITESSYINRYMSGVYLHNWLWYNPRQTSLSTVAARRGPERSVSEPSSCHFQSSYVGEGPGLSPLDYLR